jgi:ABC-type sugar transport system ATPase subunit
VHLRRHSPTGEVYIRGTRVNIHHPEQAIHKVALITEDRKVTGLN